jgi:catechol-2,3-dioxygenase
MIFALGVDGQHLAITAFDGLDSPPVNQYPRDGRHVAFAAASQAAWDAFRTRVEASAAEWWDEDHGDQRSVYVADPSGNVLEVTTPPSLPWTASHESPAKVVERFLKKATPPQPRSRGRRHSTAS